MAILPIPASPTTVSQPWKAALINDKTRLCCAIPSARRGTIKARASANGIVEQATGLSFPSSLNDSKKLVGVGVRKKSIFGFAQIDLYAFGIYADQEGLKENLTGKYGNSSEIKNNDLMVDVVESDFGLTARLEIAFPKLNIGSVRSAFEESIGGRLQKFSSTTQNQELLTRFTSQFKDSHELKRGTKIHITKHPGYVLQTMIENDEVGNIESKLLCQSFFDLYTGKDPVDKEAINKLREGFFNLLLQ